MNIFLNGKPYPLTAPLNMAQLAQLLQLTPTTYAIERNREIVPKTQHESVIAQEGDVIEIVTFIGGG